MRIMDVKINVTALVKITGEELIKFPYIIHNKAPMASVATHPKETSLVNFVFQDLTTCGNRDALVNVPATKPRTSI